MACSALLPRTRLYCTNCGENVGTERITGVLQTRQSGGCESAINSTAARRAHGSSARPKSTSSGDASHLRQGAARHARLNRVKRTVAEWFAQSTSEWPKTSPRGSNGGRSPLGLSFFDIFLQTKKDIAPGGRRNSRAVGKKRATKDGAVGDRRSRIAARTNVLSQQKTDAHPCVRFPISHQSKLKSSSS